MAQSRAQSGQIRIIGGEWRGRKLTVPNVPGLRPTPDRVRETVFNWLAPTIRGAYCLDLFAGSGAFGFEALSRGASHVVMLDQSREVIDQLQKAAALLKTEQAEIYLARAPEQLKKPARPFDIVFLDPPYQDNILSRCCFYLEENGFLANNAIIYLEAKQALQPSDLPTHWQIIKSKKTGQVAYHLAHRGEA